MIRRIALCLIIILILNISVFSKTTNNYDSLYYTDISDLKEAWIIDQLYELKFIEIFNNKENKFTPNKNITYQEFYASINKLQQIHKLIYNNNNTNFITHKEAIQILYRNNIDNYNLSTLTDNFITRLDLANFIYTYLQEQDLLPINLQIVDYAFKFIGVKYKRGGNTPEGFDCSGYVQYIFKHFNIEIGRTCNAQYNSEGKIEKENLQPGDIIFFERTYAAKGCTHTGIYIGNNQFIHAESNKTGVTISSLNEEYYNLRFIGGRCLTEQKKDKDNLQISLLKE